MSPPLTSLSIIVYFLLPLLSNRLSFVFYKKTKEGDPMPINNKPNRLIAEKSTYFTATCHNPVDWFPWGEETYEKAKRENKPVLVSIGYS